MNIITKKGAFTISLIVLAGLLSAPTQARSKKNDETREQAALKDNARYPIGCTPVGYQESLKIISLFPGKEGALQSMYFFFNKLPETVSLYQMREKDSEYSTRYNHTIRGNSWAVLATGEPLVKFICTLGDGKTSYGKIVDCAETIKICEYVHVKFGLNNKGNFWIVDSNTRNGAVNEVVHYGIIPGV
ncbi:endopeptidase IV [Legionella maioricensis]|uniref:Endopeptidase IV n=1 Tax=Legionella maioricensis TaxID=2896528 RepID=A0A9X2IBH2_9GAMM|nr:endopeptidase IV [Legionella maioricensis]MCL9683392.1 endopeptidase IV [Legionella maioricensis]MCL9685912.1 endopeptidase IV [Legionella maioricensis]